MTTPCLQATPVSPSLSLIWQQKLTLNTDKVTVTDTIRIGELGGGTGVTGVYVPRSTL